MSQKKAINHGEHNERGEKTKLYAKCSDHPLGDYNESLEIQYFRRVHRVRRG